MKRKQKEPAWVRWSDEKLLDLRLSDLKLTIKNTPLERNINLLYGELKARGLKFRPHFWLSDQFFCPDGVPGIAIPFYLAHPRLARLERNQMLEVEGGTHYWFMKILRHEVGHAIENAYRLRRRKDRQELFGHSSDHYPQFYLPKPYSKKFVLHLDSWYAQSHPDEDFAETFAVWLTPGIDWKDRYAGWPALKKLRFMDNLMEKLRGKAPVVKNRTQISPLYSYKKTLRRHYEEKKKRYGDDYPSFYDRDLKRLFSDEEEYSRNLSATQFIRTVRKETRRTVARWTGAYQYTIERVLSEITLRSEELGLRVALPEERARTEFTVFIAVQTLNFLHGGRHRVAL